MLTFGSVVFLWVVFRAERLSEAWNIFAAMLDVKNVGLPEKFGLYFGFLAKLGISFMPLVQGARDFGINCGLIFILLLIVFFAPNTRQFMEDFRPSRLCLTVSVVLAVIAFMNFSGVSDFLYFQF